MSVIYNFSDHTKGDTFREKGFTITVNSVAVSIKAVKMEVRKNDVSEPVLTLADGSGITIDGVTAGRFSIDKQIIDIPAGRYIYDISITTTADDVFTYIKGSWNITQV